MKIIVNNNVISANSPAIYCDDRGLLLGDGLFETIKADAGKLLFFEEHYKRLVVSADQLFIPFKLSLQELEMKCQQIIEINKLAGEAAIRITLTRGRSDKGVRISSSSPTLMLTAAPYHRPTTFPTAYITTIKRNEYSILTQLKTLNYLESILARQQAIEQGYKEGIMLNTKGAITESSIGNLFAVIDDEIVTPKITDGILPGIVRQIIINVIKEDGVSIIEKTLYPNDLFAATEIFQTNSLLEIQSFSKINEHSLLTGKQAIITNQVLNQYQSYKNKKLKEI